MRGIGSFWRAGGRSIFAMVTSRRYSSDDGGCSRWGYSASCRGTGSFRRAARTGCCSTSAGNCRRTWLNRDTEYAHNPENGGTMRSQRTLTIPQYIIDDLSRFSIRRVHRVGLKTGALPSTMTEFLFRKIWRQKSVTPVELVSFQRLHSALLKLEQSERTS